MSSYILMMIVLFNIHLHLDMSDISEEQLVLYAQMANLVNFILQWPEINIKEIAENFSKVLYFNNFINLYNYYKLLSFEVTHIQVL